MRRHIVRTLLTVLEHGVAIGRQSDHKGLKIAAHRRVGIFAQDQRGAGMMSKDMAETLIDSGLPDNALYLPGDFISTTALGVHVDALLVGMMF